MDSKPLAPRRRWFSNKFTLDQVATREQYVHIGYMQLWDLLSNYFRDPQYEKPIAVRFEVREVDDLVQVIANAEYDPIP